MSSSGYPMLYGKPIDKLKVTELREELKKRSLPMKGLKEELVRRLAAAIQEAEREQEQEEAEEEAAILEAEKEEEYEEANREAEMVPVAPIETALSTETTPPVVVAETMTTEVQTITTEVQTVTTEVETITTEADAVVTKASDQDEKVDDVRQIAGLDSSVTETEAEVDEKSAAMNNNEQVSDEVIPVTGIEVKKSDCISTDSVSNNEKIELELKDNEIADNDVKLDQQNVSKSRESHPMDVEEPLEQKTSGGDDDISNAPASSANADKTKDDNNVIDAGDSEKLNLDRSSSGDESMDDEPETKQTESVTSDKSEKTEMVIDKEETRAADVMNNAAKGEEATENKSHSAVAASEKRKLPPTNDQGAVVNNEPAKRQRRWNSESVKVPEVTNNASAAPPATTITPRSTGVKRDFARSDSSVSEDGPKERVVPPSPKQPTNSLRIDRFLRPFTLKAVQELLGKTGNVTNFWMDHIKTHCYVSYGSVEEAAATREAVYNLQWPPNGGRNLIAEFVGEEEVKAKLEAPLPPPPPPPVQAHPQAAKPQVLQPHTLPPPPPLVNNKPHQVIERLPLPPPPPPPVIEQEAPIVTLDDLFKKTKAIPRIYYLPLSEEQVAAKLAANNNSK